MKYFIIFTFFLITITSCNKDFLDQNDSSSLNRQSYVKDLITIESFTNGIQANLDRYYLRDLSTAYADVVADNLKPSPTLNPLPLGGHYRWAQIIDLSSESFVNNRSVAMNGEWKSSYLIARQCNFVIEDIGKYYNENPALADRLKGQALAIRAMIYHKLVNIFSQNYSFTSDASHSGIPYIKTSDVTAAYHRHTVGEVYNFIISDLTDAIQLLPENYTDTRFMNKNSAKALLARVYLYKGDFQKSKQTALEITSKVPLLKISEGYPDNFSKLVEKNETLYQLTPAYIATDELLFSTSFISSQLRSNRLYATQDIVDLISKTPDDIRSNWFKQTPNGWSVIKYPAGVTGTHLIANSDYYQPVIRSSEMFLTVAEAAAKTEDENTARDYLNAVRLRCAPSAIPVTATGNALLDSIYSERRKELAFEGTRMFDIQRWHQKVVRVDAQYSNASELPYPSNKAIAPIPQLDVNIAGLNQNTDY